MTRWFRIYDEILDDPKVQLLSPEAFKAWVNLLAIASRNDGHIPPVDTLAFALRLSVQDVQSKLDDLILAGLIDIQPDKRLAPHNWARRQWKSDDSTDRVKRHRGKRKSPETAQEQDCNGDVTVTVTAPETESDTETELVTPLPPTPEPRREQKQDFGLNLKKGKGPVQIASAAGASASREVREITRKRAEGLGLPIETIIAAARRRGPNNLDAYVQTICRKQLRERLPTASDDLLRQAFGHNPSAFAMVCRLLTMVEA